jgi:2-polyprenyl-3-methyl-5-hydroxy-6-metoxy-1,4-benzoquinol methylase
VTLSCSPGLPPNKIIGEQVIPALERRKYESVLDFGAGNIRQSLPLLTHGFQVCAVEFEQQFQRPSCAEALEKARGNPNFSTLIYPANFKNDKRKFDVALLCYVLQTMPVPEERTLILKLLKKKLKRNAYIVYMSQPSHRYG